MKASLACLACMFVSSVPLFGTPERTIRVEEDFLGSNETGFAILRTETDNHGRYYCLQVTRYLDEYEKVPEKQPPESSLAHRVKRTTLLDVLNYNDPPTKEQTVKAQDSNVKLAELLARYPNRAVRWDAAKFAKFSTWKKEGYFGSGRNEVISDWSVRNEVFGIPSGRVDWALEEAMEDMNCLYLRMTIGHSTPADDEGDMQSRWVCILPDKTRQIHDHLNLQPFYLSTGSYATADEAMKRAREIIQKSKETNPYAPDLEIWSVRVDDGSCFYTVVLRNSMEGIQPQKFKQLKVLLGADLSPTTSEMFDQKTKVIESP